MVYCLPFPLRYSWLLLYMRYVTVALIVLDALLVSAAVVSNPTAVRMIFSMISFCMMLAPIRNK